MLFLFLHFCLFKYFLFKQENLQINKIRIIKLIYWEEAYILQRNAEALVVASKETGLEVRGV